MWRVRRWRQHIWRGGRACSPVQAVSCSRGIDSIHARPPLLALHASLPAAAAATAAAEQSHTTISLQPQAEGRSVCMRRTNLLQLTFESWIDDPVPPASGGNVLTAVNIKRICDTGEALLASTNFDKFCFKPAGMPECMAPYSLCQFMSPTVSKEYAINVPTQMPVNPRILQQAWFPCRPTPHWCKAWRSDSSLPPQESLRSMG